MRSTITALFVLVTLVLPIAASAGGRFLGFTTSTFDGAQGVRTYTEACQADVGAGTRMCTSEEVLSTVTWPPLEVGEGWVRPVFQPIGTGMSPGAAVLDASGEMRPAPSDSGALSCGGWSSPSSSWNGMSVDEAGSFQQPSCNVARSVACCLSTPSGVAPAFPAWAMGALSVLLIGSTGWVMAGRRRLA
jgi:hypothetical protein